MRGIPIFSANETDFSGNGLGLLLPTEAKVTEHANGEYSLLLKQPITDDMRWTLVSIGGIIKVPCPVRESPIYSYEYAAGSESRDRQIYRVNTHSKRLNLRQKPSLSAKIIRAYAKGTEVVALEQSGDWTRVAIVKGGATGWMWTDNLLYVRTETEQIETQNAVPTVVKAEPARDQLFRIYKTETNSDDQMLDVYALHIFYDLRGNVVFGKAEFDGAPVASAVNTLTGQLTNPSDFDFNVYGLDGTKKITQTYTDRNIVSALLDPDTGIVPASGTWLIRDNYNVFILGKSERDRQVVIRRGKNLLGVVAEYDDSGVITRIIPVGKDKEGESLRIPEKYVDSARINDYPVIHASAVEYDITEVEKEDDADPAEGKYYGKEACYAALRAKAAEDFEAGVDLAAYTLTVDYITLNTGISGVTEDYAALQSVHLFDTVKVIDSLIGLTAVLHVVGYVWDALGQRYESVTLGDIEQLQQSVPGYSIADGTMTGAKLIPGSVGGSVLRDATIGYAKINAAAIGQLNADSISAVQANIKNIVAGQITTDALTAGAVTAEKISAEAITTEKLAAGSVTAEKIAAWAVDADRLAVGSVTAEKIASKTITAEQLKAGLITADSGLIAVGAIQTAQIADGSITSAKIVELSADVIQSGTLMTDRLLLVGEGGVVYEINAASSGLSETELTDEQYKNYINGTVIVAKSITAAQIAAGTITANEIATNAITAAKINVSDLFAAEAAINAINAMDITGNRYLRLMVTDAVDGVQVGGRNYILGTSEKYTAVGDGTRHWYYPWSCPSAAVANGLFGQTVTISFDYEAQITSGDVQIHFGGLWWGVKAFDASSGSGRHEDTVTLGESSISDANLIYMDGTFTGSVTISRMKVELGNKATDWTPAPEDPAGGVKTSSIEIADDHIDVSSGGSVNIRAGSALNVNSGTFDVVTGDFKMSLAKGDGTDVVMDIDDDGDTTFKAIHAGNVREAEYGYAYFTTATMGSLAAMAEYLSRTDARIAEYSMSGDEYGYVSFARYNGAIMITGNGHRLPEIATEAGFTGTLWIRDAYLSQSSDSGWCARALAGRLFLENCWFAGGTTRGLQAAYTGEVRWYRSSSEGLQGFTLEPFIQALAGGVAYYYGAIPGGGVWENGGWAHASGTVTVVSGDGGSGSAASTASVAGTLGYYGSSNGWHGSECFQGYTNAKGRAYGCLSFDLSGVGTIQSAKLTLHRKSGVGLNRKANVTVYGTTAGRGSNPANGLTGAYASGTELISWDAYATLDVTAAAQALKSGTIKQLVLYTGETGVYSGKVYSYHYAQFDSATLEVVYT